MTAPGLCGACRHVRVVESRRGSVFYMCQRAREDPRFPRYPRLPVVRCIGYERGVEPETEKGMNND